MKKFVITALAISSAIASPAFAEDGAWTGPYVGATVGYGSAKTDQSVALGGAWASETTALQDFVTANYPAGAKVDGVNYGGQLGYTFEAGSGLVLGVEAELSGLSGKETVTRGPLSPTSIPSLSYTVTNSFDPKINYAARAKVGFASGNTMFYATGGWGWTEADVAVNIVSNGNYLKNAALSHTFDGFEVGGGIEHRFDGPLSVKLEYIHADRGDLTFDTVYGTGSSFQTPAYSETFTQDLKLDLVRVGVNFRF